MVWMGGTSAERPCAARHATPRSARGAGTLWVTPLEWLKTASCRIAEGLTALAEGLSISAVVHVFGHRHATITTWLTRAGEHSAMLHDRIFRDLHRPHIQLDELRTRLRSRAPILWVWVAIDPISKLVAVLYLGSRTQDAAHRLVHELRERLASGCLPVFTSDGLNLYFYALTAHFGQWVAGVRRRARQWPLRGRLNLRPGEEDLSAAGAGAAQPGDALWDARCAPNGAHWTAAERAGEHRVCRVD